MQTFIRCLSIAVGLILTTATCADEKDIVAGKLVSIDVAIIELAAPAERVGGLEGEAADKFVARLLELEVQGKLAALTRVRLSTIEEQTASVQFGENAAVVSGRNTMPARTREGAPGIANTPVFTRQQFGTVVSATPRVEEDGAILIELQVEKSGLAKDARVPGNAATEENAPLPRSVMINTRTTFRVQNGQTVIAAAMHAASDKDTTQTVILVTARTKALDGRGTTKRESKSRESDARSIKIFHLRFTDARGVVDVLEKLMMDKMLTIAADQRTNSLIVNGAADQLTTIAAILIALDEEPVGGVKK
jgi:type II secretory pathway component GspD/PulD (secretin)